MVGSRVKIVKYVKSSDDIYTDKVPPHHDIARGCMVWWVVWWPKLR